MKTKNLIKIIVAILICSLVDYLSYLNDGGIVPICVISFLIGMLLGKLSPKNQTRKNEKEVETGK